MAMEKSKVKHRDGLRTARKSRQYEISGFAKKHGLPLEQAKSIIARAQNNREEADVLARSERSGGTPRALRD